MRRTTCVDVTGRNNFRVRCCTLGRRPNTDLLVRRKKVTCTPVFPTNRSLQPYCTPISVLVAVTVAVISP